MPISVKVLAKSLSPDGVTITSIAARYHRFIHPEVLTHRDRGRNSSSSRAVPIKTLIREAVDDPAVPIHWGRAQKGMQAYEELFGADLEVVKGEWHAARMDAVRRAQKMAAHGAAKQVVNRILEPFTHISTVMTATDWANFFWLRRDHDVEPHMRALAEAMHAAIDASRPRALDIGEWHLPYIEERDYDEVGTAPDETMETDPTGIGVLRRVSAARCARVSYLGHDGERRTIEQELAFCSKVLLGGKPHASPFEHQATPDWIVGRDEDGDPVWANPKRQGPMRGWQIHRKFIPNESMKG